MTKNLLTIVLLTVSFVQGISQRLTSTTYELGPDKKDCKIYGECDCCTSDLYFLDDQKFALIDHCTFDVTLTTGSYKIVLGKLILTFGKYSVTHGQDVTTENSKPYINKDIADIEPIEFTFSKCDNGGLMLENMKFKSYKFGLRSTDDSRKIAHLLNSDEWKLLTK